MEQYQTAANGNSFTEELRTGAVSKQKLGKAVSKVISRLIGVISYKYSYPNYDPTYNYP